MMEDLKPCPFCGERLAPALMIRDASHGLNNMYQIECEIDTGGCGARSGWFFWRDEAVNKWNRRATNEHTD